MTTPPKSPAEKAILMSGPIHGPGAWARDCRKWVWRYEFEGPK